MARLLIDTNILLLLVVGTWDRDAIPRFRRTDRFGPRDFDLLTAEMATYEHVVTTAPVLTEASNLMRNQPHPTLAGALIERCRAFVEVTRPKDEVFAQDGFHRLGYADASVLAATDDETVVLTDDVALYTHVFHVGRVAINFNHLRKWA